MSGTLFVGTAVESVGLTPASSSGTAVTPGTTSEGSWTLLGTLTNAARYMGVGCSIGNGTMTSQPYHVDLAYSTSDDGYTAKFPIVEDMIVFESSTEQIAFESTPKYLAFRLVPAGARIYGRAWCAGTATSGFNLAAWAVR